MNYRTFSDEKILLGLCVGEYALKADLMTDKEILEVGPGTGNLTREILRNNPAKMYLIEKDTFLAESLKEIVDKRVKIFNEDILKFDENLLSKNKIIVFGNLPYNISTDAGYRGYLSQRACPCAGIAARRAPPPHSLRVDRDEQPLQARHHTPPLALISRRAASGGRKETSPTQAAAGGGRPGGTAVRDAQSAAAGPSAQPPARPKGTPRLAPSPRPGCRPGVAPPKRNRNAE